jgi:two-component system NarL family sensor kinase
MRPGMLDVLGLVAAIEDYVDKFATRTGIHCDLTTSPGEIKVSDQIGINTFRIVQEALNNVQKYAQATRVSVHLEQSSDGIALVVEDNGIGLPQDADGGRHGFGVRGMKERVAILNGRFSITGLPGQGVRIEVVIPTGRKACGNWDTRTTAMRG